MNLEQIRAGIDKVDDELLELISKRAALAEQVATVKEQKEDNPEFYRPEREAKVLNRIMQENPGPLSDQEVRTLFREIMSACLAREQALKIAYLGPEGTYTQAAALIHFGNSVKTYPFNSISAVFRDVELGECAYGVVPIENSTEGVVTRTLDQFMHSQLKICGEVETAIHHNLLSCDKSLGKIKKIYAHQQSFAQCRRWLNDNLPNALKIPVSSNAEAARMNQKQSMDVAAIAGAVAADIYGLNILARNIEDEIGNSTRFLVIGKKSAKPSGKDKTSMILLADNKPGALYRLLKPFADNDVSMSRIESRPSRRTNWEYVFFVDVAGHAEEQKVSLSIAELEKNHQVLAVLGSYPVSIKY